MKLLHHHPPPSSPPPLLPLLRKTITTLCLLIVAGRHWSRGGESVKMLVTVIKLYSVHCTVYSVLCTVYCVQSTVYSVQCALHKCRVQCTVYTPNYSVSSPVNSCVWCTAWRRFSWFLHMRNKEWDFLQSHPQHSFCSLTLISDTVSSLWAGPSSL